MSTSRIARGVLALVAVGGAAALVACLNPQPLPPEDKRAGEQSGSGGFGDGTTTPPDPEADQENGGGSSGGTSPAPAASDGGADGGDAGR